MSSKIVSLGCEDHPACVVQATVIPRSEVGHRRPLAAPSWLYEWAQAEPDWYVVEIAHSTADVSPGDDALRAVKPDPSLPVRLERLEKMILPRTSRFQFWRPKEPTA